MFVGDQAEYAKERQRTIAYNSTPVSTCFKEATNMGVRAGLTLISVAEFRSIAAGDEPEHAPGERFSIDKAWLPFHTTFKDEDPPLKFALTGDCLHPASPHGLDEFCEGGHEYYVGFVSPELVVDIANALADWKADRFDSCGDFFDRLKAAYQTAAARKQAMMICIA